jgi:hypothetical protein
MELIEAFTRQDADLGSTFICEKEVTIKLNGEDLKNLLNIEWSSMNDHLAEEQIETVNELFGIILEGVTNYDLV